MLNYAEISDKLKTILGLESEPVAVTLLKPGDEVPEGYMAPEKGLSHCQSIMKARKGESLVISADNQKCSVGASSLGLISLPDKIRSGHFHHGIGMFESPASAKRMIDERFELDPGTYVATAVSPLKDAKLEPDVVVLSGLPEQVYWLIPASTYRKGGRVKVETAAFQATCVDATLIPMITSRINLSLGCYGCRRRTDIAEEEMLAGIPPNLLEEIVEALEEMAPGPMAKARS